MIEERSGFACALFFQVVLESEKLYLLLPVQGSDTQFTILHSGKQNLAGIRFTRGSLRRWPRTGSSLVEHLVQDGTKNTQWREDRVDTD